MRACGTFVSRSLHGQLPTYAYAYAYTYTYRGLYTPLVDLKPCGPSTSAQQCETVANTSEDVTVPVFTQLRLAIGPRVANCRVLWPMTVFAMHTKMDRRIRGFSPQVLDTYDAYKLYLRVSHGPTAAPRV